MHDEELFRYLRRLELDNKRLREALKPFAEWSSNISSSDIDRAKELLNESPE